jgi:shikimate kinase
MRVFLIGLSGSGKSKWAKKLANKLEANALDLDQLIEQHESRSIQTIISNDGEDRFRLIEKEILRCELKRTNFVMACGGGTPCFFDNLQIMKNSGYLIFFNPPLEILASRLLNSYRRPLLQGKSATELKNELSAQMISRKPFYEQAHEEVNPMTLTAENQSKLQERINRYFQTK